MQALTVFLPFLYGRGVAFGKGLIDSGVMAEVLLVLVLGLWLGLGVPWGVGGEQSPGVTRTGRCVLGPGVAW